MIRRSILIFVTLIVFLAGCSKEAEKNAPEIQNSSESDQSKATPDIQPPSDSTQSEPSSEVQSPTDSNQTEPQTSSTDEQILMKTPGRFAGSNYNEQKVQAALDQLPSKLTADQYKEELLLLLAEDYRPYVTIFNNFETEVKVNNERPDDKITLPTSKKLHISILLDASGSMKAQIHGKSKMDSAKEAIQSFADKLPQNAEVSLRVYGHKGTGSQKDKQISCNSTEEIFHGQGDQTNQMKTALQGVQPTGWTPIANALKSVKQDINPETTDSVVYVVSDGIETCGGNPVQIAKELNQSKVKTVVNIIGFNVDNEGQKLLRQVATSGGGEFTSVDNDESLKNYLNKAYAKLQGEWTMWKEKGEGQANTQKEKKQGTINNTETDMQILANKEYDHLLVALRYLETKRGKAIPHGELWMQITERKGFAWTYARDTKRRLYDEVTKSGNQVYDDIKDEGDKNIDDLKNKKNN
ncbi:VWA domain-containing protein [Paenibacillus dokdonensis]|uniref:VWA domain-containing protein n=1 Tax=Paenibacillus dokdonensis TaxID=2567944 RepID=A0ABU6GPU9_9BACL|nr:VWA domain-containing protein [Paenibacillus dokdonensis]MEC0240296.1 VWA domain-containing protein [Paenibacillus dokdonensis]